MQLTIDHGKHENRPKGEERPTNGHLWLEKYQLLILAYLDIYQKLIINSP
jgi:hypothetical protein